MMKYVIVISLLIALVGGVVFQSTRDIANTEDEISATDETSSVKENSQESFASVTMTESSNDSKKTASTKSVDVTPFLERRKTFQLDAVKLSQSVEKLNAITLADPKKAIAQLNLSEEMQRTPGRNYVNYDPYVLEAKAVGDKIDILIPDVGITFRGTIETIETEGDIIRWQGCFQEMAGGNNNFSISQTMSDNYAVGSFDTSMGSYNIEVKNGVGWIISQANDFHLPEDGVDTINPETVPVHTEMHPTHT